MSSWLALTRPARPGPRRQHVWSLRFALPPAPAAGDVNVRRDANMNTMIRPAAPARVAPGQLLGARQLADVVRRLATTPADWLRRGPLNPESRRYERVPPVSNHEGQGNNVLP